MGAIDHVVNAKSFTATALLTMLVLLAQDAGKGEEEMPNDVKLPMLAVHMAAPGRDGLGLLERFIAEAMPRLGIDTLVLEINYRYDFKSRPELAAPGAIGREDARRLLSAARGAGVDIVPLFNCVGHQSWRKNTFALLEKYPEFDEAPNVDTDTDDFYCRSWCPRAPGLHEVVFDLVDEIARDFEADAFHCGMDEIFIIADDECPRCSGADPADILAAEIARWHAHLQKQGIAMWIWGDRLIDGPAMGVHKWEASHNGTAGAVDHVPKDIVICDWHYRNSPATPAMFAEKGFRVISCPWQDKAVALEHLKRQQTLAASPDAARSSRAMGILQTVWSGRDAFIKSCLGEEIEDDGQSEKGLNAAESIKALSLAMGRAAH